MTLIVANYISLSKFLKTTDSGKSFFICCVDDTNEWTKDTAC